MVRGGRSAGLTRQPRTEKVMHPAGVFLIWGVETLTAGQDQDVIEWDGLGRDGLRMVKWGRLRGDVDRGEFLNRRKRGAGRDREVGTGLELEQYRSLAPGISTQGSIGLRDWREVVEGC